MAKLSANAKLSTYSWNEVDVEVELDLELDASCRRWEIIQCSEKPHLVGARFHTESTHPFPLTANDIKASRRYNDGNKAFWIEIQE